MKSKLSLLVLLALTALIPAQKISPSLVRVAIPSGTEEQKKMQPIHAETLVDAKAKLLNQNFPLVFVENRGQWDPSVKYMAQKGESTLWLKNDGMYLASRQKGKEQVVHLLFEGASNRVQLTGENASSGKHNYLRGNDPKKWQKAVPGYESVRFHNIYQGVNLQVKEANNHLEYDLLVAPKTDLTQIKIRVDGVKELSVDPDGSLIMETALGPIKQTIPLTWEELPSGEKRPLDAEFKIFDNNHFGFQVPQRNQELALVIDPGLEWSTFWGSSGTSTQVSQILLSNNGDIITVGYVMGTDLPLTPGTYDTTQNGLTDIFITRFSPDGSQMITSTLLGGSKTDQKNWAMLDDEENIIIVGETNSPDFPTTAGSYDQTFNGGDFSPSNPTGSNDMFISKIDPSLTNLLYSTYIGGSTEGESLWGVKLDTQGNLVGVGFTASSDFPTTPGAYDTTYGGGTCIGVPHCFDAVVLRLKMDASLPPQQQLLYSTYLGEGGPNSGEIARDIVIEDSGDVIIAGTTNSPNFPVTPGAYDTSLNVIDDTFIMRMRLDPTLPPDQQILYSTFFGGKSSDNASRIVSVSPNKVIILGTTSSNNFPTTPGAYDQTYNGGFVYGDGFVAELLLDPSLPAADQLLYSTYLGGTDDDSIGRNIVYVPSGNYVITGGVTFSSNFPTTLGAYDQTFNGGTSDAFISQLRLAKTGQNDLIYSTYIGGSVSGFSEAILGIARTKDGSIIAGGQTPSSDFPTTPGAYLETYPPSFILWGTAFLSKLDMLPTGVSKYGDSSNGGSVDCPEYIAMGVTKMPKAEDQSFGITVSGAPPNAQGYLLVGTGADLGGIPVKGAVLHLDLTQPLILTVPIFSDSTGYVQVNGPLPLGTAGAQFFIQTFWLNTAACGGVGNYSASNALDITIQP
jgi:hypothetical protein